MNSCLNKKGYLILSVLLTFLYSLPFLLSPFNFMDDLYRSMDGSLLIWLLYNARPASYYFYYFISGNSDIAGLYPFSFIVSFILLYCTYIYTVNRLIKADDYLLKLSVFVILLSNPFFLQNLSFKYDSLPMTISIGLSALFVFRKERGNIFYDFGIGFLTLLTLLCVYQPALSLVAGFLALRIWAQGQTDSLSCIIKNTGFSLLTLLMAFLFYKYAIASFLLSDGIKASSHLISLNLHFFSHLFMNIRQYAALILLFAHNSWISLSLEILAIVCMIRFIRKCNLKTLFIFLLSMPLLLLSLTSSNILLATPLFHLREMMGFSAAITFLFLMAMNGRYSWILGYVPFSFYLAAFLLSCSLLNYKRLEYEKSQFIRQELAYSIDFFGSTKVQKIAFTSDQLLLPAQTVILQSYPLLRHIYDGLDFNNPWYAMLMMNDEFNIPQQIISDFTYPAESQSFKGCFTQSVLQDATLHVRIGAFCK